MRSFLKFSEFSFASDDARYGDDSLATFGHLLGVLELMQRKGLR